MYQLGDQMKPAVSFFLNSDEPINICSRESHKSTYVLIYVIRATIEGLIMSMVTYSLKLSFSDLRGGLVIRPYSSK